MRYLEVLLRAVIHGDLRESLAGQRGQHADDRAQQRSLWRRLRLTTVPEVTTSIAVCRDASDDGTFFDRRTNHTGRSKLSGLHNSFSAKWVQYTMRYPGPVTYLDSSGNTSRYRLKKGR
jgi:hypothetical protein